MKKVVFECLRAILIGAAVGLIAGSNWHGVVASVVLLAAFWCTDEL